MKDYINVGYLLVLVIGTFGLVSLLRYVQKEVLASLEDVLVRQGNLQQYIGMLQSKKLGLVFRKGTLALLKFNGYLYYGDEDGTRNTFKELESVYLKEGERLDYYQKKLNFLILTQQFGQARETFISLEHMLAKEKDDKLKAILDDARLLMAIYVEHDTTLIPSLLSHEKVQIGNMQGITRYRIAKLFWYSNNKPKALEYLALAHTNLKGTSWEPLVKQALENPVALEER